MVLDVPTPIIIALGYVPPLSIVTSQYHLLVNVPLVALTLVSHEFAIVVELKVLPITFALADLSVVLKAHSVPPVRFEVLDTFKIKSGGCDTVAVTLVGVEYLLSESIDAIQ